MNARQAAYQPRSVLYPVAALSLIAGLIHLWVTPSISRNGEATAPSSWWPS
jgi:hypothetical protein